METTVTIELRHNNVIFKCVFCDSFFNTKDTKAYAVAQAKGVLPDGKSIAIESVIVCSDCWDTRKKAGFFEDPINIVVPKKNGILKL